MRDDKVGQVMTSFEEEAPTALTLTADQAQQLRLMFDHLIKVTAKYALVTLQPNEETISAFTESLNALFAAMPEDAGLLQKILVETESTQR